MIDKLIKLLNRRKNKKFLNKIKGEKISYHIADEWVYVYIKPHTHTYSIDTRNDLLVNDIVLKLISSFNFFDIDWVR